MLKNLIVVISIAVVAAAGLSTTFVLLRAQGR